MINYGGKHATGTDNGKVVFDEDYAVTGIPGQTLGDVETMIKRRMQGTIDDYKRSQRLAGFSEADLTAKIADIKSGLVL